MNELHTAALRALKLMDLTTLNDDDTNEKSDHLVSERENGCR